MLPKDGILPPLEINLKKIKTKLPQRKQNLKHILISPLCQLNKLKAYSFFNSIKAKNNQSQENQKASIERYTNRTKDDSNDKKMEILRKKKLGSYIQIKDINKKYIPCDIKEYKYFSPENENYLTDKILKKNIHSFKNILNDHLKIKSELKSQKEKEILYQKNIENKYNINLNRIKTYSRNKKLFISSLKKYPKYFNSNYQKYIKSISKNVTNSKKYISQSSLINTSTIKNMNNDLSVLSNYNMKKNNSISDIFNNNNNKFKITQIKIPIII